MTAGIPAAIRLTADRGAMTLNGLAFVSVELVYAEGRVVPTADQLLSFEVKGNGMLQAAGNGNGKDEDPYYDNSHQTWHGRALAVVRNNGKSGKATLTVAAKGLPSARLTINTTDR